MLVLLIGLLIYGAAAVALKDRSELLQVGLWWPGGPHAFMLSLSALSGTFGVVAIAALHALHGPRMNLGPDWAARIPNWILRTTIAIGTPLAILATMPMVAGSPGRRERGRISCRDETLSCWFVEQDVNILLQTLLLFAAPIFLGGILLIWGYSEGDERRFRLRGISSAAGLGLLPMGAILLAPWFSQRVIPVAERWPGELHGFVITLGVFVPLAAAAALVALWVQWRLRNPATGPLLVSSSAFTAALAAGTIYQTKAQRGYSSPLSCVNPLYCHFHHTLDTNANNAFTAGVTSGLITTAVLIVTAIVIYRRRKRAAATAMPIVEVPPPPSRRAPNASRKRRQRRN